MRKLDQISRYEPMNFNLLGKIFAVLLKYINKQFDHVSTSIICSRVPVFQAALLHSVHLKPCVFVAACDGHSSVMRNVDMCVRRTGLPSIDGQPQLEGKCLSIRLQRHVSRQSTETHRGPFRETYVAWSDESLTAFNRYSTYLNTIQIDNTVF